MRRCPARRPPTRSSLEGTTGRTVSPACGRRGHAPAGADVHGLDMRGCIRGDRRAATQAAAARSNELVTLQNGGTPRPTPSRRRSLRPPRERLLNTVTVVAPGTVIDTVPAKQHGVGRRHPHASRPISRHHQSRTALPKASSAGTSTRLHDQPRVPARLSANGAIFQDPAVAKPHRNRRHLKMAAPAAAPRARPFPHYDRRAGCRGTGIVQIAHIAPAGWQSVTFTVDWRVFPALRQRRHHQRRDGHSARWSHRYDAGQQHRRRTDDDHAGRRPVDHEDGRVWRAWCGWRRRRTRSWSATAGRAMSSRATVSDICPRR